MEGARGASRWSRSAVPVTPWALVAIGGLVAAAIDLGYACAFWAARAGLPPSRVLQSIAAGLWGPAAFAGGAATAALGLLLHVGIALAVAGVYYFAARHTSRPAERPWLFGAAYGLGVYAIMTYVVVPLSAAGPGSTDAV
jgi:hypothetical protein